jgi:hypothetical protein
MCRRSSLGGVVVLGTVLPCRHGITVSGDKPLLVGPRRTEQPWV